MPPAENPGPAPALWLVDVARSGPALLALEGETPRVADDDRARAQAAGGGDRGHPAARHRLAVHVALRLLIESSWGAGARSRRLPFVRGPHGRPRLAGFPGDFSLSHSAQFALIGIAGSGSVGVDIEAPRAVGMSAVRRAAIEAAAEAVAPDCALPEGVGDGRLLSAWVRLEAFAKARRVTVARVLTAVGAIGGGRTTDRAELARRLAELTEQDGAEPASTPGPVKVRDLALGAAGLGDAGGSLCAAAAWTACGAPLRSDGSVPTRDGDPVPRLLPWDLDGLRRLAAGSPAGA